MVMTENAVIEDEDAIAERDARDRATILAIIPPIDFEMLARVYINGETVRAVAEVLGMPKSSIHSRLARTKKRLSARGYWPIRGAGCVPPMAVGGEYPDSAEWKRKGGADDVGENDGVPE